MKWPLQCIGPRDVDDDFVFLMPLLNSLGLRWIFGVSMYLMAERVKLKATAADIRPVGAAAAEARVSSHRSRFKLGGPSAMVVILWDG